MPSLTLLPASELISLGMIFASFLLLLCVLIYAYLVHSRVTKLEHEEETTHERENTVLKEAQEKARKLIEKAQVDAQALLTQTQGLKVSMDQTAKESLNQATQRYMTLLEAEAKELFSSYKNLFVDAIEKYLKESQRSLSEARTTSQSYFATKVDREFAEVKRQLEDYKKEQMSLVDQKVEELVGKIARQVLGRSINTTQHKDLIEQALDEAKKMGVFNS